MLEGRRRSEVGQVFGDSILIANVTHRRRSEPRNASLKSAR